MTRLQLEELLHHEIFLQWLARRLLRDAARADDVVQETWLAVLHSNKSPREVHRGWLAAVLRNLARRSLREERRRARREQRVARPHLAPPSPSRLDAEELRVQLARHVLRLPEHYREALLLRYYEGLEPAEIASLTGVAASTVRTRIQRGLAKIRGELDASAFSLAPLLQIIAAGKPATTARLAPFAAAALVLLALWGAWPASPAVPRGERRAVELARRSELRSTADSPTPANAPAIRGKTIVRTRAAPILTGRVELPHGVAHEFARVELAAAGGTTTLQATTRSHFAFDLSAFDASARLQLTATHPECEPVSRTLPPGAREITVRMQRRPLFEPAMLVPVVPEEEPRPTEPSRAPALSSSFSVFLTATVHLPGDIVPEPIALAVCNAHRCLRFRVVAGRRTRLDVGSLLRGTPSSTLVVRIASRRTIPIRRVIPVWSGPRLDPLVVRLERGRLVRGRVFWEGGVAAAGVTVAAIEQRVPLAATRTDATGRFELTLPEGATLLALASGAVPAEANPAAAVRMILRAGEAITGRVTGPATAPVQLLARGLEGTLATRSGRVAWTPFGPAWSALRTPVGAGGTFRFTGLRAGEYEARCATLRQELSAPGHVEFDLRRTPAALHLPARDAVAVRATDTNQDQPAGTKGIAKRMPATTPGSLAIDLLAGDARLLATARVTLRDGRRAPVTRDAAVANRTVRLQALPAGTYDLTVEPGGWYFASSARATVVAGAITRIEMRLDAGGRIQQGDADLWIEPALAFAAVAQLKSDAASRSEVPATARRVRSGELIPPGRYRVWSVPPNFDETTRSVLVEVVEGAYAQP